MRPVDPHLAGMLDDPEVAAAYAEHDRAAVEVNLLADRFAAGEKQLWGELDAAIRRRDAAGRVVAGLERRYRAAHGIPQGAQPMYGPPPIRKPRPPRSETVVPTEAPAAVDGPPPAPRRGLLARLFGRK